MKSTKAMVKRFVEAGGYMTDSVSTAIYILADGQMIDGEFDGGCRGQDHRIIECAVDGDRYDNDFWDNLHKNYRVVRLVPETGYALLKGRQRLTEVQKEILSTTHYEIERY